MKKLLALTALGLVLGLSSVSVAVPAAQAIGVGGESHGGGQ